jgi:hypothetical protein
MTIPAGIKDAATKILDKFCKEKTAATLGRIEVICKWRGVTLTLLERKPWALEPSGWVEITVAQFRFDAANDTWSLHYADRNSRWHSYDDLSEASDLQTLLDEVNEDPTGIFWG